MLLQVHSKDSKNTPETLTRRNCAVLYRPDPTTTTTVRVIYRLEIEGEAARVIRHETGCCHDVIYRPIDLTLRAERCRRSIPLWTDSLASIRHELADAHRNRVICRTITYRSTVRKAISLLLDNAIGRGVEPFSYPAPCCRIVYRSVAGVDVGAVTGSNMGVGVGMRMRMGEGMGMALGVRLGEGTGGRHI